MSDIVLRAVPTPSLTGVLRTGYSFTFKQHLPHAGYRYLVSISSSCQVMLFIIITSHNLCEVMRTSHRKNWRQADVKYIT